VQTGVELRQKAKKSSGNWLDGQGIGRSGGGISKMKPIRVRRQIQWGNQKPCTAKKKKKKGTEGRPDGFKPKKGKVRQLINHITGPEPGKRGWFNPFRGEREGWKIFIEVRLLLEFGKCQNMRASSRGGKAQRGAKSENPKPDEPRQGG